METVAKNEVEAAASSVDVAEGKGTVSVPERVKKVSRKSQHIQEQKELCTGRICRRAKLSCCGMCPCQHKRECPIGMQQETKQEEMTKPGGKMSKSSQALLAEAMEIVGDPVQRTETKRKTRTVEAGGYAELEQDEFEDRKKPKQLTKEEKIAQIFDICGVAMPSEGKTKNFGDGTFVSGSAGYVKHQYNTNKALSDAVSSMVVGMNVQDFLKVAVEKIPAAQKQFSELYGEELLAVKIGRGVMAMYKAAPRKVKATIIEG